MRNHGFCGSFVSSIFLTFYFSCLCWSKALPIYLPPHLPQHCQPPLRLLDVNTSSAAYNFSKACFKGAFYHPRQRSQQVHQEQRYDIRYDEVSEKIKNVPDAEKTYNDLVHLIQTTLLVRHGDHRTVFNTSSSSSVSFRDSRSVGGCAQARSHRLKR